MTKSFRVTGRVQGVGFRWSTQEEARNRGLAGWVQNDDDGAVSGLVQGESVEVEDFLDWLHRGPRGALVKNVETEDAQPVGLRVFTIRSVIE